MIKEEVEQLISKKEAAAFLKVSTPSLERWIREGILPADLIVKRSGRSMFYKSQLAKAQADGRIKGRD